MLIAIAGALPFLLLTAGVVWQLTETERATRRDAILFSTRAVLNGVDAMLSKHVAIAQMLAKSPALLADDLPAFRQEAERALPALAGSWVLISDQDGQQLLDLARPAGDPLARRNPAALESQRRALDTGQIQISNVFKGALLQIPMVTVEVPIIRPDKPPLALSVVMDTRIFLPLLDPRDLPDGWLGGLVDRNGNVIARSRDHDRTVGQPASEGFRMAMQRSKEGWNEIRSLDGNIIANGHVSSDLSGWVMGLAADQAVFEAPIQRIVVVACLAGGAVTFLSMLLAMWAARRIATPIERLQEGSHALLRRKAISFSETGVAEVDRALDAFSATASALEQHERERDEREAQVHLLMRELSHRSKNLLAIVLAIARQTNRQSANFQEFETRFNARVQALADAHDLLVEKQWAGAAMQDLALAQLSAFGTDRFILRGEPASMKPEAVQNIGLALHELATNASKYGALSVPGGKVLLEWTLSEDGSLRLRWEESGGPRVAEPKPRGFGRLVLERVVAHALGQAVLEFRESGLVWICDINPEHVATGGENADMLRPAQTGADRSPITA
jgi:two-component sensor histidine kinase